MDFLAIEDLAQKEQEQFKTVCNHLLSRTFVVHKIIKPDRTQINNPNYTFLARHFEIVRSYLSLLDWDLFFNEDKGYYYVINTDEANRLNLNKVGTALIVALRLIYDENQDRIGLHNDIICATSEVMEKIAIAHQILPGRLPRDEIKKSLVQFDNHSIIQRINGRYNDPACTFAILPTILTAVPSERLAQVVLALKKEESHEEVEESSAD